MQLNVSNEVKQQVVAVLGNAGAAKVFELVAKAPHGFIGLADYVSGTSNKKCLVPGIANVTVQLGDLAKKAQKDIATVAAMSVEEIAKAAKCDTALAAKAKENVLKSLENKVLGSDSTDQAYKARREGQENAYINLGNGFRLHIGEGESNGTLHFSAFEVSKSVIQEAQYEPTNSRPLTLVQNLIKKGLLTSKFRTYRISHLDKINLVGESVEV